MKDFKDYNLKAHNTFGIDAKCRRYIEFEDDFEAMEVAKILRKSKMPYIIIGGGWCALALRVIVLKKTISVRE